MGFDVVDDQFRDNVNHSLGGRDLYVPGAARPALAGLGRRAEFAEMNPRQNHRLPGRADVLPQGGEKVRRDRAFGVGVVLAQTTDGADVPALGYLALDGGFEVEHDELLARYQLLEDRGSQTALGVPRKNNRSDLASRMRNRWFGSEVLLLQ